MMALAEEMQPRFDRADWALRYAYIAEAMQGNPGKLDLYFSKDAQQLDDFQLFMRRITSGMSKDEIMADGIMLKNTLIRHLDRQSGRFCRWVIGARYRIPSDSTLHARKQDEYLFMANEMKERNRNLPDKWFVVDVIRGYMEGTERMHKSYEDWARHIGVSDKTIYRWAGSREPGYKSIKYMLGLWETEAMVLVTDKLMEMGELQ